MSNMTGYNEVGYFSVPNDIVALGILKSMDAKALKLYVFLLYRSQRTSNVKITATIEEVSRYTGISNDRTVSRAQKILVDLRLIKTERVSHGYAYHLLSPGSGEQWIKPEKVGTRSFDVQELTKAGAEKYYRHRLATSSIVSTDNGFKLQCPFHSSNGQTLNVTLANGSSWNCWGCGLTGGLFDFEVQMAKVKGEEINRTEARKRCLTVLRHLGVIDVTTGAPEAIYDYCDGTGTVVLYQKVRYPGKVMSYRRPDPKDPKKFINSLGSVPRVLYNLRAVNEANVVCILEGEKDVDRVTKLGLTQDGHNPVAVTCNPHGSTGWHQNFTYSLKGKNVIIVPDNDVQGRAYARGVAESLRGHAASVLIRNLPLEYKDCSDMLDVKPEASDFTVWLDTKLVYQVSDWKII